MVEENGIIHPDDVNDFSDELALEFDVSHDPEAVWEWNGESWIAVAA